MRFLIVLLLLFTSCSLMKESGFSATEDQSERYRTPSSGVDMLIAEKAYKSSGNFLRIKHPNGSSIDLFIPSQDSAIDMNKVINVLENNNDASSWPFYYCPLGRFNADSIKTTRRDTIMYIVDTYTNIGANNLFDMNKSIISGYTTWTQFVEAPEFCLVKGATKDINHLNFDDPVDDGPEVRDVDKNFFYMFDESVDSVSFLLPYEDYCGHLDQ